MNFQNEAEKNALIGLAINKAYKDGYNKAVEDCARVAEKYIYFEAPNSGTTGDHEIATEIRKLKK